jgi:hypothetical protein
MSEKEANEAFERMMKNPELIKMFNDFRPTGKDLFPDDPSVHDWNYRDVPRMTPELWDLLLSTMGEGNYRVVVASEGNDTPGVR